MTDYAEYLNSPKWANVRARVLARDSYRCQDCGIGSALHVHHLTYEDVGHEYHWQLITLCAGCHMSRHDNTFRRAWNGATWDTAGSDTEWRGRNWTELRSVGEPLRDSLSEREESFYAEKLHGDFGGDLRVDAEWLDELTARD
jgi:hypothetical protein